MRTYAKAYLLGSLRKFDGWTENNPSGEELTDESIVFVWDDFKVTTGYFDGDEKGYLYDNVSPEWQAFCKNELDFEIPEDVAALMRESEAEEEQQSQS